MPKVEYVQAEFTPAEVAAITGISQDSQRTWRLRKILPRSKSTKHKRFRAQELGELLALKAFSDSGVPMERVKEAAAVAALPVWSFIANSTAEELGKVGKLPAKPGGTAQRYVIVRGDKTLRAENLRVLNELDDCCLVTHVFDCVAAAALILERAPRKCLSVMVTP